MQDGGDGLQDRRAEGFYAQGIKPIHSLLTAPPYSPPQGLASPPLQSCKINSRSPPQQATAEARGTAQQTASHTAPAPPPATEQPANRPTATHSETSGNQSTRPRPIPTKRAGARTETRPHARIKTRPRARRYSGRVLNLCGCGGAKYF